MKKIIISIATIVAIGLFALAFTAPWLWIDNGEDIMESRFFRARYTDRSRDAENFKKPKGTCGCDGSCLNVKWRPFGVKVDACARDYYFISFWGQRFYMDGDKNSQNESSSENQRLSTQADELVYQQSLVQSGDIEEVVRHSMESVKGEIYYPIPQGLLSQDINKSLELLQPYTTDPDPKIRRTAYSQYFGLISKIEDPQKRLSVITALVHALEDPEPLVSQGVSRWLQMLEASDFSSEAKQTLHTLLLQDSPLNDVIRLVGIAQMKEEMPRLRSLIDEKYFELDNANRYSGTSWPSLLALTRIGQDEDAKRAVKLMEAADEQKRALRLFGDLAYTRHPIAIVAVGEHLWSKGFIPGADDHPPFIYSHSAVEALAENIPNFPVSTKLQYTDADVAVAQEWIRKQNF